MGMKCSEMKRCEVKWSEYKPSELKWSAVMCSEIKCSEMTYPQNTCVKTKNLLHIQFNYRISMKI